MIESVKRIDPLSLGRGRYWFAVSCRRTARRIDAERYQWEWHITSHLPWNKNGVRCGCCRVLCGERST